MNDHQTNLVVTALGDLVAALGITNPDAPLTGPELLHAAHVAKEQVLRIQQLADVCPADITGGPHELVHNYWRDGVFVTGTRSAMCTECHVVVPMPCTATDAQVIDSSAPGARDQLRRADHIHDTTGRCVKNRHGGAA